MPNMQAAINAREGKAGQSISVTPPSNTSATASGTGRTLDTFPPPTPFVMRKAVLERLAAPVDIGFTTEGLLYYLERDDGLFLLKRDQSAMRLIARSDIDAVGRLRWVTAVLDPASTSKRTFYVLARIRNGHREEAVIERFEFDATWQKVGARRVFSINAPFSDERIAPAGGGALRFSPTGHLYVGLGAEVLRMDRDGKPIPGNRPPPAREPHVFVRGTRAPVAIGFHPNTEALLVAQGNPDEILRIEGGAPHAQALPDARGLRSMVQLKHPPWHGWQNAFALGFDRGEQIDLVRIDINGKVTRSVTLLRKLGTGFAALAEGSDGLYVATSGHPGGEQIWRLTGN